MCVLDFISTPAACQLARDVEALGFGSIFLPEGAGKESFSQAAAMLSATDRIVVGTAIANIHIRDAVAAEAAARALHAMYPDRFVLGLGVSHPQQVEGRLSLNYGKPLSAMRSYLERMDAVPSFIDEEAGRPPRLLAALGPKMIELSGRVADGAIPYLVLPEQTAHTREIVGPDALVVSEVGVTLGDDAATNLRRSHAHLSVYDGLENYRASWRRQGFDDTDFVPGGSDRLAEALVGLGPDGAKAALDAHLDAGADHVIAQVLGDELASDPRPGLERLAAVLGLSAR
ncbi:TIGR03620 family F420-dependent LLM class oxidoreductase [Nocardioides immobilis]|uniref:TIGR03620 family F420-dependent LLM class oxidoreductase n=2 Tax=Nocardioides immobilis TaxID=2049295 RepID=A0A417Y131_9ACTN|nr:TIGR03620 family F420-dependent LLM class oxidoreductase [Nocardioides immobilis]